MPRTCGGGRETRKTGCAGRTRHTPGTQSRVSPGHIPFKTHPSWPIRWCTTASDISGPTGPAEQPGPTKPPLARPEVLVHPLMDFKLFDENNSNKKREPARLCENFVPCQVNHDLASLVSPLFLRVRTSNLVRIDRPALVHNLINIRTTFFRRERSGFSQLCSGLHARRRACSGRLSRR